jgi:hypothetical protein
MKDAKAVQLMRDVVANKVAPHGPEGTASLAPALEKMTQLTSLDTTRRACRSTQRDMCTVS